jgi:hypothetical protein
MEGSVLLGAGCLLLVMVGVGTVAHELTHAIALRAVGIGYDLEWFPQQESQAHLNGGILGPWATVTPRSLNQDISPWKLQLSAVAPVVLTVPVVLMGLGVLPSPLTGGNLLYLTATLAWLGCALPSPQDFSLFWHAGTVIEQSPE